MGRLRISLIGWALGAFFLHAQSVVLPVSGGFGKDTSGWTGCPTVTAGVWNYGACPVAYVLPVASTTVLGGVKVDGTNCTVDAITETLTCAGTYSLPSSVVKTDQANTYGAWLQDFSNASVALPASVAVGLNTINQPSSAGTYALTSDIPSSLPPSGSASGDLCSNYPDPTVCGFDGVPFTNTPPPSLGNVICYDGVEYTPCPPTAGSAQILYVTNTTSDISGYDLWDTAPLGSQFTVNASIPGTTVKTLIQAFGTASGYPDIAVIPAGEWQSDTWVQLSSAGATAVLNIDVYDRTTVPAETLLFSFPNQTISGNGTGIQHVSTEAVEPSFAIAATDRLVVKYSVTKTGTAITATLYGGGSTNYSHIHTPIGTAPNNPGTLTFGTHLAAGGSSYNGSANATISSDATDADTASTIVARDSNGDFSAHTITAALSGNATTASNGVPSGMIAFIDTGTCPAGWTEDDAMATYFVQVTTAVAGDVGAHGVQALTAAAQTVNSLTAAAQTVNSLTAAAQGFTGDTTTVPAESVNSLTAAAQTVNTLTAAAQTIAWPAAPTNVPTNSGGAFTEGAISWPVNPPTASGAAFSIATTHEGSGSSNYVATTMAGTVLANNTTSITLSTQPTIAWPANVPGIASGSFTQPTIAWPTKVPTAGSSAVTGTMNSSAVTGTLNSTTITPLGHNASSAVTGSMNSSAVTGSMNSSAVSGTPAYYKVIACKKN